MFRAQKTVHGMIHEAIVNPFDLAGDAFELETQPLWNGSAAGVFSGTLDGDPVQFPDVEAVINHGTAAGSHDAFSLMFLIQPIAKGRPSIDPIDIQMVDHAAEMSMVPDARIKSAVVGVLLLPVDDGSFNCWCRTNGVNPGVPPPDMIAVGIQELEQFVSILTVDKAQFRFFINAATKHTQAV